MIKDVLQARQLRPTDDLDHPRVPFGTLYRYRRARRLSARSTAIGALDSHRRARRLSARSAAIGALDGYRRARRQLRAAALYVIAPCLVVVRYLGQSF